MEPEVIINGQQLTQAQVMTLRAAVSSFSLELSQNILGNDEHGKIPEWVVYCFAA